MLNKMNVFPTIYTKRLILTQLTFEYLPALVKHANNQQVSANIVNIPHPYTDITASMRRGYVTKQFKDRTAYCFVILLRDTQEFIGEISLHVRDKSNGVAELGYWIGEPFWNNKYASESVEAVLEFGLVTLKYQTIYATCHPENIASKRLLIKHGMKKFKETTSQLAYKIMQEN